MTSPQSCIRAEKNILNIYNVVLALKFPTMEITCHEFVASLPAKNLSVLYLSCVIVCLHCVYLPYPSVPSLSLFIVLLQVLCQLVDG